MSVCFSAFLYPLHPQLPLRVACHSWRHIGLTMFHVCKTNRVGPAYPPAVCLSVCFLNQRKHPTAYHFGSSHQRFGLVQANDVCGGSLMLTILSSLAAHPHQRSQALPLLTEPARPEASHVAPVASHVVVANNACKSHVSLHTNTLVICAPNIVPSLLTSEACMKRIFALMLMAVCLGTALSGCIVVPGGGGYYHRY
jgi:hypothetical protein